MAGVHPKEVLREARDLESRGESKKASLKYASLIPILMRRSKFKEAVELCEKVLKLSPSSTRLHITHALCLNQLGQTKEAFSAIEKFALGGLQQNRLSAYLDIAKEKLVTKLVLYKCFLETVLKVERTEASIFFLLSGVLSELGENERALEITFAGLKVSEKSEEGRNLLKSFILKRANPGETEAFEKWINGELSLEQLQRKVLFLIADPANEQAKAGNSDEVSSYWTMSILKSFDENSGDNLKKLIQDLEEELGQTPKGIEPIHTLVDEFRQKARTLVKDDSLALIDLAVAFREMGLLIEAKEFLLLVSSEDPKYLVAQSMLGEIELESGATMGALDIFQMILRNPQVPEEIAKESLYSIAKIYIQLGDLGRAEESAQKLSNLDRHYRGINKVMQAIINRRDNKVGSKS
ncbi:MAG: tetratricopeptide repeat protein [Proteobacteria bacterium]|nr:tetratricopeptide repeat protein [Pseudomonadota bacterium]